LIFSSDDTCVELENNFQYIVSASMPIQGASTTAFLRQTEAQGAEKLTATTIGLSAYMTAKLS